LIDLLQSDAATGRGQEQGVEAGYELPPGYSVTYVVNRACKASGLRYYIGGGAGKHLGGCVNLVGTMENHYLQPHQRKDAEFCSDQCRNLWRDTMKRREAGVEI
jgi:hypothetical protein